MVMYKILIVLSLQVLDLLGPKTDADRQKPVKDKVQYRTNTINIEHAE